MGEGMSEPPESYESAVERLEQIIDRLDSGQAGLRETLELCREGRELVTYCAAELDAVGEGLQELRLDELAAKLEQPTGSGAPLENEPNRPRGGTSDGQHS
jgi:exodeoxyribonuclease VII small subunit